MKTLFRSLVLSVTIGLFLTQPVFAGGDTAMQDETAFTTALEDATQKNDISRATALITETKNSAFVSTETLSTPLTSAIQNNNPNLALLFLKEGKFRIHMAIPHTAETPLNMATTAQAYDVADALMTAYTFGDHELNAAMAIMSQVEHENRLHAKKPIDKKPIDQAVDTEPSTSTVGTQRLIDEIALSANNTYVIETGRPFKDLVSKFKNLKICTTDDVNNQPYNVPNTISVVASGNV